MKSGHRAHIVVLDDYERSLRRLADWTELDRLADIEVHHDPLRGAALHAALADADAIVLRSPRAKSCNRSLRIESFFYEELPFILITTDTTNVASRRVIEANGGVLVEQFIKPLQCGGTDALRFRIAFS